MDLDTLLGMGAVPLVVGLVELVKPFLGDSPERRRWYPVVAIAFGMAIQILVQWTVTGISSPAMAAGDALTGVVVGLAASGLYSATKQLWPGGTVWVGE